MKEEITNGRTVFHVDMDAFFASVEQRDNPAYRGKPVIVGAMPGRRGVVSAASYEARRYGIHSAQPINQAYARCPSGVFVRPRMDVYSRESHEIMAILSSFSPVVEQISVDEAFMDMTGTQKLFGDVESTARAVSDTIRVQRGLTASIGVAPNMFLAKIASDLDKPDGITVTPRSEEEIVVWLGKMAVGRIWGVGARTQETLALRGITTIEDLQRLSIENLENMFGKNGRSLYYLSRGVDSRIMGGSEEEVKSISREHTYSADTADRAVWRRTLLSLSQDVARRARGKGLKGATVVLTYRTPDFQRRSRRAVLPYPTDLAKVIFETVMRTLNGLDSRLGRLRLIGVGLTNFESAAQTDLFADENKENAWKASENAMDRILKKFGADALRLGGEFDPNARK